MKSILAQLKLSGPFFEILFSAACVGLSAINVAAVDSPSEIILFSSDAVTIARQTQFITLTNGAVFDRTKKYLNWQVAKVRGANFPALSPEITVGGLANLYRSVDTLSAGIMVPLEFFELKTRFPTNCILTNAQTSLRFFRQTLLQVLRYNDVVGVREGPLLKLVKREWVRTNSPGASPVPVVQPGGAANRSQPGRPETNPASAAAGRGR